MTRLQGILIGIFIVVALLTSGFWIKYQERTKPGPSAAVASKGSPLHRECTPILEQMTKTDDCEVKIKIYNENLQKCGEIYDSASKESYNYRLNEDGNFSDRILTNSICLAIKGNLDKAKELISSIPSDSEMMVEHGGMACAIESFKEGFASSLEFPKNSCVKASMGKDIFLKALNSAEFSEIKNLTRIGRPIFLEINSDNEFSCPVSLETVTKILAENSAKDAWTLVKEQKENAVLHKFYFISKTGGSVTVIFSIEKGCEMLSAIFIQSKVEQ